MVAARDGWMEWEKESKKSVLSARLDDDDDDQEVCVYFNSLFVCVSVNIINIGAAWEEQNKSM